MDLPWRLAVAAIHEAGAAIERASKSDRGGDEDEELVQSKFGGHHAPGVSKLMRMIGR